MLAELMITTTNTAVQKVEEKADLFLPLMAYFKTVDNINANTTYVKLYLERIAKYGEDAVFKELRREYNVDPRQFFATRSSSPQPEAQMGREAMVRTPNTTSFAYRTDQEKREDNLECCGLCLVPAECCFCLDILDCVDCCDCS